MPVRKRTRKRRKPSNNASPIHAFGLFWRADEINWFPGKGKKGQFRLLGRLGKNSGTLQVVDFSEQRGIYILYGNYGPYYVGLTRSQTLWRRLRQHHNDGHKGEWDRFSWFGFMQVLKQRDKDGLAILKTKMPTKTAINPDSMIKELEALLIKSMALRNRVDSRFALAKEWVQVRAIERDGLLGKLAG